MHLPTADQDLHLPQLIKFFSLRLVCILFCPLGARPVSASNWVIRLVCFVFHEKSRIVKLSRGQYRELFIHACATFLFWPTLSSVGCPGKFLCALSREWPRVPSSYHYPLHRHLRPFIRHLDPWTHQRLASGLRHDHGHEDHLGVVRTSDF